MDLQAKQNLISLLRKGELPEVQSWEIGAAVQAIADEVARP
jgi:hypothetical protein